MKTLNQSWRRRNKTLIPESLLRAAFSAAGSAVLLLAGLQPAAGQSPRPLYNNISPTKQDPGTTYNYIDLSLPGTLPATNVDDANRKFSARAAAAILCAVSYQDNPPFNSGGYSNELNYALAIVAKMAYKDYFNGDAQGDLYRQQVFDSLPNQFVGIAGSSIDFDKYGYHIHIHGEYDVLLTAFTTVYYKYYDVLPPNVRDYLFNTLLSARGWYDPGEQYSVNIDGSITIPETENHRVMIQAAKYLANQLWFQQTHDHGKYDNNRNGNGGGNPPMVDVILGTLRNYLTADFVEYNARPYQEYTMTALLNLASYAYDDRVKLAARMVLDYISAKVAVSSNDLRRSTPFRRRNEAEQWGPSYSDGSLGTGLVFDQREPQTPFFAQLAGNTQILRRQPPASYRWGMVRAAVGDYRVPPAILDLFVNPAHRRFYQVFKHASGADPKQYGIELYAASPSYLISAGGNPTFYAYVADVAGITYLGDSVDLGVALPTTFMPTDPPFPYTSDGGITLVNIVQLGQLTTGVDSTTVHFGVAPDFACGDATYLPAVYADISSKIVTEPHWTFIDRSSDSSHPGYFLAVYHQFDNPVGGYGFMEAFDTWLHPGYTFDQFINGGNGLTGVWTTYRSTVFSGDGVNTYVTQLGQQIQFTMSAQSEIVATTALPQPSGSIFGLFRNGPAVFH